MSKKEKFPVGTFLTGSSVLSLPWLAVLIHSQDPFGFAVVLWAVFSGFGTMGILPQKGEKRGLGAVLPPRAAGLSAAALSAASPWLAALHGAGVFSFLLQAWAIPLWAFYLWHEAPERRPLAWLAWRRRGAKERISRALEPSLEPGSLAFEAAVPAAPPPDPDAKEVLIGEGSFRVDAARAVDKLSRFRLADRDAFLLPWVRLAVASGASSISLDRTPLGLRLSFDGEPLPSPALKDPYACLFGSEGPDVERSMYLAQGLLGAMFHRPDLVRVSSGAGEARACLCAGLWSEKAPQKPSDGKDTVLELEFGGGFLRGWFRRRKIRRFLSCIRPLFPSKPVRLRVDSREVPEDHIGGALHDECGPGTRIQLRQLNRSLGGSKRMIRLFKRGVRVEEIDLAECPFCRVLLDDDAFNLDLSGAKVVRNETWQAAMKRIGRVLDREA